MTRIGATEEEVHKTRLAVHEEEAKAATVLIKVARRGRWAEFPEGVTLSDVGKALHLLCARTPEKGDRLLLLLAGWRDAEAKSLLELMD